MAKDKSRNGATNKHIHARISYLKQAATYLADQASQASTTESSLQSNPEQEIRSQGQPIPTSTSTQPAKPAKDSSTPAHLGQNGIPPRLTDHLIQVARKTQIRLDSATKHAICKRCRNVLIDGKTSKRSIENVSKGGKKPHADVLVVECGHCSAVRRFPVGAIRQRKKGLRAKTSSGAEKPVEEDVVK